MMDDWGFESVAGRTTILWFAVVLPASILIATLSYYLIERRALGLKHLVKARKAPPPGESVTEPAPIAHTRP